MGASLAVPVLGTSLGYRYKLQWQLWNMGMSVQSPLTPSYQFWMTAGTPTGCSDSQIVSNSSERAEYTTTLRNFCCDIKCISKHFRKGIKAITPILKVGKWSHRDSKQLSITTKRASGRSSANGQLCCKLAGWCLPRKTAREQNRPVHQPWKYPCDISRIGLKWVSRLLQRQVPSWK